ncbi:MAG TPA: acetyl-CoA sensor PanZ family protein [Spongiibacteraceae bacterium]|nr:acetyl-CoA sensor PanZ family protein [Spongiibacteraceae bacterium]
MPVTLEIINRPDANDLADLEKIYADYFQSPTGGPLPPVKSLSDWLDAQREAGQTLIAGRFNDRLLAALWLDNSGRITHLCVRAATRRRGTARQLLQLLQTQAAQLQRPQLEVRDEKLAAFWQELGFQRTDSGWLWTR